MLYNRFAAAKRTRDTGRAALGQGEKCIENSLAGNQRFIRHHSFFNPALPSDRPDLKQLDFNFRASLRFYPTDCFLNGKFSALNINNLTFRPSRDENAVLDKLGFLHIADNITDYQFVPSFLFRSKNPFSVTS